MSLLPEITSQVLYHLLAIADDPSKDIHVIHAKKHYEVFHLAIEKEFIEGFHFQMRARTLYRFSLVCKNWHTLTQPLQEIFWQAQEKICKWETVNTELTWRIIDYLGQPHSTLS